MITMLRSLMKTRLLIWLILAVTRVVAAERSADEWLDELAAAHARLDGYVATYSAEKPQGQLDAIVGMDQASGLVVLHVLAAGTEGVLDARMWVSGDDEFIVSLNGDIVRVAGMKEAAISQLALLGDTVLASPRHDEPTNIAYAAHVLLDSKAVAMGFGIGNLDKPNWRDAAEGSSVIEIDKDSITFLTLSHGRLKISREHGILLRQTLAGADGTDRVFELRNLELNPGKAAVAEIFARWETEGARQTGVSGHPMLQTFRLRFYQEVITGVERGNLDLLELEKACAERKEEFRNLCASAVTPNRPILRPIPSRNALRNMRDDLRQVWLKSDPQAAENDQEAFAKFLRQRKLRNMLRDQVAAGADNELRQNILAEILGKGSHLRVRGINAAGRVAKSAIEDALVMGYVSAVLESAMTAEWGPPED
jgi:hypothetical protein